MIENDFNKFARSKTPVSMSALYAYQQRMNKLNPQPTNSYISPTIIEERQMNITQMGVFSRMLMDNIIFLGTGIDDDVANIINAQLLFLQSINNTRDISLYLNTPGGGVYAGLSIVDTMEFIDNKVNTIVCGMAASMGFVICSCGDHRSALRHSRFLLHQPMGGAQGQQSDIEIAAKEIKLLKTELYDIISEKTGQPYEKIEKDGDRDYWMTAKEALEYHVIDEIIQKKKA